PLDRLESLERRANGVCAWVDRGEDVLARFVRDDRSLDARCLVRERDLDARNDAIGILDRTTKPTLEALSGHTGRRRRNEPSSKYKRHPASHGVPSKTRTSYHLSKGGDST